MNGLRRCGCLLLTLWGMITLTPMPLCAGEPFAGREMLLTVPGNMPPPGQRALVVALHGGMGNADHLQRTLGLDGVANRYGFLVVYLNGSQAGRMLPTAMHAWNSGGGCCGLPADTGVDDVAYISQAVAYLVQKYAVDPSRVYVTGHSNGAMMAQTLLCRTALFAAAVPISGPLNADETQCPAAKGRRLLAIHGEQDENVPLAGGKGSKGVMRLRDVAFNSEAAAKSVFEAAGASYTLDVVPGADHALTRIESAILRRDGMSLAEKEAQFFGLAR